MAEGIETKTISSVHFGLMSPKEIRDNSVVEVISSETFANGKPIDGGLFDLKMGSIEGSERCTTCKQLPRSCPGHFGHIELAAPIFHPEYIDNVKKVLEVVCFSCSKILIEESQKAGLVSVKRNKKLERVRTLVKTKRICYYCQLVQPTIKRVKGTLKMTYSFKGTLEGGEDKENHLTPNLVREIFKRISNEDAFLLGFLDINRPEFMVLECIPVSPPSMRPTVTTDSNQRGEDDLTVLLSNIMQANRQLRDKINNQNTPENMIINFIENLNLIVSMMIAGGVKKGAKTTLGARFATRNGNPLKNLRDRVAGKSGRIRKNLMGKRVNFSARSVISPDPNLDIDELGVPMHVAEILTVPVIVNDLNREEIMRLLANRGEHHPAAVSIVQGNQIRTLKFVKDVSEINLKTGDIVLRQLQDGDVCLFNRQPTLHKMSMMAFRAKIMPIGNTFRINLSVTTPLTMR